MRPAWILLVSALLLPLALTAARAHDVESKDLPAGPIRDRHELMEGIGKNAKAINDATKSGDNLVVQTAAEQIEKDSAKITALFPPGSTFEKSRAKPEIWTNWPKFEDGAKQLTATAGALAAAAKTGGDVPAAAKALFGSCKSCHEQFRVPDKD
ncbi:MAG: cytochrome c [Deltaproteobacteria bacterium]|nr:cytochrome c [Deltaproteobacteria bacterium]MBI3390454.1 cytochrome c [Deltaproteobacteria bacterium]